MNNPFASRYEIVTDCCGSYGRREDTPAWHYLVMVPLAVAILYVLAVVIR